jgi:hypothetical protein
MRNRQTARTLGVFAILVVCCTAGRGTSAAARDESLTVFLDLPTTNGFSDATQALVETKDLVREPLSADPDLRLVDRAEDADVVLTVLGRGRGDVELTAALRGIDRGVVAPPVPIAPNERYIEVLITTGPCRTSIIPINEYAPESCYRRIFVGVGFGELGERRSAKKPRLNSWEACAEAVIRDVRAWLISNAERLRAQRVTASR